MSRRRPHVGALDPSRISRGLARAGNDLRHWVSYGTVAAVRAEDGDADYEDPNAVVITPAGVEVDVVLEPSGYPCTARHGISAGAVFICGPIRPGDQVIVEIPDGDPSMVPEIAKVIPGSSSPIPTGDDGLPIFRNDRLLVYARDVPIDLRTSGGARVRVDGDQVILNEGQKGVARVDDPVRNAYSGEDLRQLAVALLTTGGFAPGGVPVAGTPVTLDNGKVLSGSQTVKAGG